MVRFDRLVLLGFSILSLTVCHLAQGGDGRSDSVASRTSVAVNRYVRRTPKPRRIVIDKDATPIIETGRLSIVLNEGGSRLFLSKTDSDLNSEFTASNAPSLIVRTLPVGQYKLLIKKPGYFDETRIIDIFADKRRKVVVNMRPQMALLTVNTNLKDSEIEISGIGKFRGSIQRYFVKPGSYGIAVTRRGFVSQTAAVDLRTAGREQNLSIVLQPLRIDSMLDLASQKLVARDLEGAATLTNDVLLLNAAHAKANLLYGQILFQRGDHTASSFFGRAIIKGETLTLPVKILESLSEQKLVDVELRLDRAGLSLRSSARVDLNFTIARSDMSQFRRSTDSDSMPYIVVAGKSDFFGRPFEPHLTIYSNLAVLAEDPPKAVCTGPASSRSCSTDIEILFRMISSWIE